MMGLFINKFRGDLIRLEAWNIGTGKSKRCPKVLYLSAV
jgi:hypothetical protein